MANRRKVECIATTVEIILIAGPNSVPGHPLWRCPVDCVKRPGGHGGQVRVRLGNAPKKWGNHEAIHGVVGCSRIEGSS
ncbi:MAG: hypothetical protein AAB574_02870 [Patescibacteria group bacterium]